MKILFMGTPEFAAESLKMLYSMEDVEVVGVFTQPDKPVGRKHKLEAPPVKLLAEEHGTPVLQPVKLRDGTALDFIRERDPELIAVVSYGRILPDDILNYPKYGAINIHGSLLPRYRGAAPIQYAVLNGDKKTGVTSMYMAHDLDAGDIIDVRETEILPGETSGELFERLAVLGAELLRDTVRAISAGTAGRTPQDHAQATFTKIITKEMARISWELTPREVICLINGMQPWPVATAELGGTVFKIYRAVEAGETGREPGTILAANKEGIRVAVKNGSVLILELQAPGGKRMAAGDYLRGHPLCL